MMTSQEKGDIGEDFINEIAYKSFIKYWCFPNPKDEMGDKKEICDLLIVFKDVVVIICVKNYEFKGLYDRYFRKTIEKDVKQIGGAERKLLNLDIDTFIKHPDRDIEKIDKKNIKTVLRLVVHLGDNVRFYPLLDLTKQGCFVNIFDKDTFKTIVSELDTLPDFIDYLQKREKVFINTNTVILPKEENDFDENTASHFFNYMDRATQPSEQKQILISGTEYDLLAYYLRNNRQFVNHLSNNEYNGLFLIIDGEWDAFTKDKQLKLKKEEDKISYFIDEFVKREVLKNLIPGSIELAKELLSFNRFDRRVISKSFFNFYDRYKQTKGYYLARRFGNIDETGLVFVFYTKDMKEEHVNKILPLVLESICVYNKYKHKKIILIATTNELRQFKFGFWDNIMPFDKETEQAVLDDVKRLGWFTQIENINFNEKEYPDE